MDKLSRSAQQCALDGPNQLPQGGHLSISTCGGNSAIGFANFTARHLRRQQALLTLWRHTLSVPSFGSPKWREWLEKRQLLLNNLALLPVFIAGATENLEILRAMQENELRIIEAIAHLEAQLLARGQEQLHAMVHLLHMSAKQQVAHRYYRQVGRL